MAPVAFLQPQGQPRETPNPLSNLSARGGKKVENISRDYEKSLVDTAFILSESS